MSESQLADADGRSQDVDELARLTFLEGIDDAGLAELQWGMRRRELPAGAVLWSQGDEADAMVLVVDGRVSLTLSLPGERTVEIGTAGSGEVLGEVPLVDGGSHTSTARATAPTRLLALNRADFTALMARRHPIAFVLKRRMATVACTRLRRQLATLAASLGGGGGPVVAGSPPFADLEFCRPPDSRYVRRLANFRAFDSLALWGILTAGRYARCPAGSTLIDEGMPSAFCCLVMNGAVERVIVRGDRRIRVGLAGPGQAFGYETLLDGEGSAMTAITRERTILLLVPQEAFARLFRDETAGSHAFLDVILRDLMGALRQALRPQARLAASV